MGESGLRHPDASVTVTCPFPDCDWEHTADWCSNEFDNELSADENATYHYEDEHAGRVRIQITLETEQLLGGRDPTDIRQYYLEKYQEKNDIMDVAHVRTEITEPSDDHEAAFGEGEPND